MPANGSARALPPIRTLTVGPGFSPGPPSDTRSSGSRAYQGVPWITAGSEFHRVRQRVVGTPAVLHARRDLAHRGIARRRSHQIRQTVRRSIATYEPGWVFATVFISEATATTSRGSP